MTFLLDTCVVSDAPKAERSESLKRWLATQDTGDMFLSAVSAGELRYGVDRLPPGRRATELREWLARTLNPGFAGRILAFDERVADIWGGLRARYPNSEVADSQIAATALVHRLTLVTRNVKDFAFDGLAVLNPWKE